jgi:hypothetical protein
MLPLPTAPCVIVIDSASQVEPSHAGTIVVTGSHGGVVAGRAIKAPVAAAFFNDAGVGKDCAGIARLPLLAAQGIVGVTVGHLSARIGNGQDTYESGVISHVNSLAAEAGLAVGLRVIAAVEILLQRLKGPRKC